MLLDLNLRDSRSQPLKKPLLMVLLLSNTTNKRGRDPLLQNSKLMAII
jgi:hypothetical protein